MTEEELIRAATRLGKATLPELDGERLAQAVLARLASEPVRLEHSARRSALRWAAGLAAAAMLIVVVRLALPRSQPAAASAAALTVLHELDDLSTAELQAVLESLAPADGATVHPESTSFDDLDTRSLERLLRSLEG